MKIVLCALCLLLVCLTASADGIEITLNGEKKTIVSQPHKPYLIVNNLEQLRQNYRVVKSLLPPLPFVIEGKWVVAGEGDTIRTFTDETNQEEYFSQNGEYVAVIESFTNTEFPRFSKKIRLMTTDGKMLWQKENGPISVLVTDDGRVIGRSQYNEDLSLTFYGRDGKEIKSLKQVFQPGRRMRYTGNLRLLPQAKLLLAWEDRELVAVNYDGVILWRYTTPNDVRIALIREPNLDPLGRGVYVPIMYEDDTSVDLVDAKSGVVTGAVWQHKPWPIPAYFSPSGQYLGIAFQDQIGLLNWKTGELLFINKNRSGMVDLLEGKEVFIPIGNAADVSNNPARLVVPLSLGLGISIFDTTGRRIWWNDIRVGYAKNFLSSDGKILGVAVTNSKSNEPLTLYGLLLYKVEASQPTQ